MTRMSEPHAVMTPIFASKSLKSQGGSWLARTVHDRGSAVEFVLLSLLLVGCVIPPSLSVDNQDAGVNSPPAIVQVSSDNVLSEPGPVVFEKGPSAGSLRVTLVDTDKLDTLYVSVFVDYHVPQLSDEPPPRSTCIAAPNMTEKRVAVCDLGALCLSGDIGVTRNMSVVVFDRQPNEPGEPFFQHMAGGGLSASKFYFLQCQNPPS